MFPIRSVDRCQSTCFSAVFVGTFEIHPPEELMKPANKAAPAADISCCLHKFAAVQREIVTSRGPPSPPPKQLREQKRRRVRSCSPSDSAKQITLHSSPQTNIIPSLSFLLGLSAGDAFKTSSVRSNELMIIFHFQKITYAELKNKVPTVPLFFILNYNTKQLP